MRKVEAEVASFTSTLSRNSRRNGPSYQGVRSLRAETLSPWRAEIGMVVSDLNPKGSASPRKASRTRPKTFSSKSTRSILFTASTTWRMPRRDTIWAWRQVCAVKPFARVDQKHGELGVRGARHHIARVLLMAWRVRDHEGALSGREITIGDVDGDALLALRFQPVDEQGIIDLLVGPVFAAVARERRHLVIEHQLLLEEQPPDEGRFAVIDGSASEEAQQVLFARFPIPILPSCRRGFLQHHELLQIRGPRSLPSESFIASRAIGKNGNSHCG